MSEPTVHYEGPVVTRVEAKAKGLKHYFTDKACCKVDVSSKFHVDHVMPLTLGGSNWPSNLQITCVTCNLKKRNKHPEVFAKEMSI